MIKISVSHDFSALKRRIENIRTEQIPYSLSKGINDTARQVQGAIGALLTKELDRPKPFTTSAPTYLVPATKSELVAEVGLKDAQAKYLGPLVRGGARAEKPVEQKFMGRFFVPSRIMPKDAYGNVSKANLLALIRAATTKDGVWSFWGYIDLADDERERLAEVIVDLCRPRAQ